MKSDKRREQTSRKGPKQAAKSKDKFVADKSDLMPHNYQKVIHDLRVHQMELAQQNVELQESQHRLEESRSRYENLYDHVPVGYFTFNPKGLILDVNRTGSRQLGLEKDALRNKPFPAFMGQEDSDLFYLHVKKVFSTASKQTCALTLVHKNGESFYAQLDSIPSFVVLGEVPRCQTSVTDISERKVLEEALKISETRYRRLFEESRGGILILDAESGQISDVNPFLTEMLGYSHGEMLGKKLWEIGSFKDIDPSKAAFEKLRSKGYVRYDNFPLVTKKGREIAVEFTSSVYLVGNHKVIQYKIRDVTEYNFKASIPALCGPGCINSG